MNNPPQYQAEKRNLEFKPGHPLCKICGITRLEDLLLCQELGVDLTGFIFAQKSPRRISPSFAASIPDGSNLRVGVFAGQSQEEILETAHIARLDLIQLHGGEDEAFCQAVGLERVLKVLWPERCTPDELQAKMERFAPYCACFLLDAGSGGGGSGQQLALERLQGVNPPRPWLLAGGLGPDNLREVLQGCAPGGVDLNSALESAPGQKDEFKVRKAVEIFQTIKAERVNP